MRGWGIGSGICLLMGSIGPHALYVEAREEPVRVESGKSAAPSHEPVDRMIAAGVEQLLAIQEDDGTWPYEGVYRVNREIPIGYRIGGTSMVGIALIHATSADHEQTNAALSRGVDYIVKALDDPLMQPSRRDKYDVRVWGHACALEFFCRLRATTRCMDRHDAIDTWIPRLVEWLVFEEIEGGGWNYANQRYAAPFVTAPVVQALLWARGLNTPVPEDVLRRAGESLEKARSSEVAFHYSGSQAAARTESSRSSTPGSAARSALCEATLRMLERSSEENVGRAVNAFFEHWDELEVRRKQTGTHIPPYGIAPYYFYFGHRYASQAIDLLPESERPAARQKLLGLLRRTRDDAGTWNDRVFPRTRNYGTAMALLALLGDRVPLLPMPNAAHVQAAGAGQDAEAAQDAAKPQPSGPTQ